MKVTKTNSNKLILLIIQTAHAIFSRILKFSTWEKVRGKKVGEVKGFALVNSLVRFTFSFEFASEFKISSKFSFYKFSFDEFTYFPILMIPLVLDFCINV